MEHESALTAGAMNAARRSRNQREFHHSWTQINTDKNPAKRWWQKNRPRKIGAVLPDFNRGWDRMNADEAGHKRSQRHEDLNRRGALQREIKLRGMRALLWKHGTRRRGRPRYFGNRSLTRDRSSFNSFTVASIFERLKSLTGRPWTISSF
jgi:hypothetical protein